VALAATAAGLVVAATPAPAQAATCSGTSGVSVVVDFHQLGGGVQTACDTDGAGKKYAADQFTDVGHVLTYVQGQAFVCEVDSKPATQCVRTPPANAYWSLWWSDGTSGTWTYASLGVASLKVPAGGYVALSWQKGTGQVPPGVTPTAHSGSSPSTGPTSHPSTSPTHHPSSHPTSHQTSSAPPPSSPTSGDSTTSGPSHSAGSPTSEPGHHHAHHGPSASTSPSTSPTSKPSPSASSSGAAVVQAGGPPGTSSPGGSGSSGLPGWLAPVLVGALFVAAAVVAVVRRRRAGGA
jgi:hypothetical protein